MPPLPRRELVRAALLLALATCVFLWEPLSNVRTSTFLTVDLLQNNTLTQLARNYQPRNQVLGDNFTEFVPWMLFAKAELLNGRIPLWNPLNGAGAPLIGNYQSAVFSLFTLPIYLLGLKLGLLVTSLARVFVTAWFTYLFLRRAALCHIAALGGALAFAFCGYNTLLVSYPHSAVVAYMPALLWCCEVIVQRCASAWSSGARPKLAAWWVLLCGLLTGQVFAGHPETLFFCQLIVIAWVGTRLISMAWRAHRARESVAAWAGVGARMLLAAVLALLMGAPQLLTFFEYLANSARFSSTLDTRTVYLPLEQWPRYVFPDLFGAPVDGQAFGAKLPWPNYEIANLAYAGGTACLLALTSMARLRRDARTIVLSLMLVAWALWAHNAVAASFITSAFPVLSRIPPWVSQVVGTFAVAVLAAFELDELLKGSARRRFAPALFTVASATTLLLICVPAARELIASVASELRVTPEKVDRAHGHVREIALWIAGAAVALSAGYLVTSKLVRAALAIMGPIAIFAQTAVVFAPYQTACADRYVYPQTRAMITLRRLLGDGEYISLTREGLPANANMLYGRRQPANYDALLVAPFEAWYARACIPVDMWHAAMRANEAALWMLGVELCTLRPPGVAAPAEENGKPTPHWSGDPARLELLGRIGGQLVHRFDRPAARARLVRHAVKCEDDRVWLSRSTSTRPGLEDTLLLGPQTPVEFTLRSPEIPPLETTSTAESPVKLDRVRARGDTDRAADGDRSTLKRKSPEGERRASRERQRAPLRRVETLDELPTELRLRVTQEEPHYLLLAKAHYPGWNAYVDGAPAELVRANYAFSALDIAAGEHVVEIRYEPASWRWGLALFGIGCCGLAAFWLISRRGEVRS